MNHIGIKKYGKLITQLAVLIGSVLITERLLLYEKSTAALIGGLVLMGILFVISMIVIYRSGRQDDLLIFLVRFVIMIVGITAIFGAIAVFGLGRPFAEGCILAFKVMLFVMMILLASEISKKLI